PRFRFLLQCNWLKVILLCMYCQLHCTELPRAFLFHFILQLAFTTVVVGQQPERNFTFKVYRWQI
ncbi:MAG: hypothetical protein ACOYCB_00005, partial [Fastidiosipilaceae bacterium]